MNEETNIQDYDIEDMPDSAIEEIEDEKDTLEEETQEEPEVHGGVPEETSEEKPEEEEQSFDIEINGEKKTLPMSELIERAKKSFESDTLLQQISVIDAMAADAGMSRDEYITSVSNSYKNQKIEQKANELSENEGFDEQTAERIARLEIERDELLTANKAMTEAETNNRTAEENAKKAYEADLAKTEKLYGKLSDADIEAITPLVAEGLTILEAKQKIMLDAKMSTEAQTEKNKNTSMGSAKGKGKVNADDDAINAFMEA